jgi:hypothetical protein
MVPVNFQRRECKWPDGNTAALVTEIGKLSKEVNFRAQFFAAWGFFPIGKNNMKPVGDSLRPIGNDTDFALDVDRDVRLDPRRPVDGGCVEPQRVSFLSPAS